MKIYFCGSICGGRDDVEWYGQIISHLKNYGEVLTEIIGDKKVGPEGELKHAKDSFIHDRDLEWLLSSDVVVGEVTTPSHGVGYELAKASDADKNILCLYRPGNGKKLSAMIRGCQKIKVMDYFTIDEAKAAIDNFFDSINYASIN
ncbi:nucleoside 2-deoxyribosyltransferase [Candidatus Woesearchaeota archaeon]|nr:nucleoside 2-deoxyribosyltransferase [Candidatus Woesearchaeota archaeon]